MQRLSVTVLRNSSIGFIAHFVIKVLSFAFSILVVRNLGVEAFGQYAAVLAFGGIFVFVADLGLSPYAVRQIARLRDEPDGRAQIQALYADLLILRLLLAILAATLLTAAAWLTGRPLVMVGAIALNALGLIMYGVEGASEAVLAGHERLDLSAGAKIMQQVAFVTLGVGALLLGTGYYGLIMANLAGIALLTYRCWRATRVLDLRPGRVLARHWPGLLRAGLPFGVITFALGLSYKFDTVLLSIFRGDLETGYYSAAYNLVFSTIVISNIVNTALYPSLARAAVSAPAALARTYERVLRYLIIISFPIAVGGCVLADQLIPFLFGDEFLPAIPALQIVIWVVPLMFVSEFLGYMVVLANRERQVARAVLVSTGLNVILNLALVPWLGLMAAAIMTVLTEAVLVTQHAWTLRTPLRQMRWTTALVRPALAALAMGGLVVLADPYLPLLGKVALGAVSYAGLLLLLGVIGSDEVGFVRGLAARRPASGVPGGSD